MEFRRGLILADRARFTPILATVDGVIVDGHRAARASAEEGVLVDLVVSPPAVLGSPCSILDLPLR